MSLVTVTTVMTTYTVLTHDSPAPFQVPLRGLCDQLSSPAAGRCTGNPPSSALVTPAHPHRHPPLPHLHTSSMLCASSNMSTALATSMPSAERTWGCVGAWGNVRCEASVHVSSIPSFRSPVS